jgi:hypothetical protein
MILGMNFGIGPQHPELRWTVQLMISFKIDSMVNLYNFKSTGFHNTAEAKELSTQILLEFPKLQKVGASSSKQVIRLRLIIIRPSAVSIQ